MTTFQDIIRRAVSDPGSIVPRGDNYEEPIPHWSARAVIEILQVTHGVDPDAVYSGTPASNALMENATLRGKLARAEQMLHDAWTIIANAEQFKHELICEASHCVERQHVYDPEKFQSVPVGGEEGDAWRAAATAWRDRWHETLPRLASIAEVGEALNGGPMKDGVLYPEVIAP